MQMLCSDRFKSNITLSTIYLGRGLVLFVFAFWFFSQPVHSQSEQETFEFLTNKDGLSQSTVNCIIQDKKGFMWFGTYDGLNKYDGHTFTTYKNNPGDNNSISGNEIELLFQDHEGYIWMINGVNKGISKFDPETDLFTNYVHDPEDPQSISGNKILHLTQDSEGNIWMCTKNSISLLDKNQDDTKKNCFIQIDASSIGGRLSRIHENQFGDLLIFADRVYKLNREDYSFEPISKTFDPSSATYSITSLFEDEKGNIVFGSDISGTIKLDYIKESNRYIQDKDNKLNVSPEERNYVLLDHKNRIWISTGSKGLFRYDTQNDQLINFLHDENNENSLSENTLKSMYIDRSGVLWIGTFSKGLCKYYLHKKQFYHYTKNQANKVSLNGNVVSAIHTSTPGEIWVGLNRDGGVNRILFQDEQVKQVIHYKHDPSDINSLGNNSTFCLVQRKNQDVWLGSSQGFISIIRPEKPGTGMPPEIKNYNISAWTFSIFEDKEGTMWGGTWESGLWKYSEKTDSFIFFKNDPKNELSIIDNIVWAIYEDNKGNLWIGGHGKGLSILPSSEKHNPNPKFINYQNNQNDSSSISSNTINAFYQDDNGTMWLGTQIGLNKVITQKNESNYLHKLAFESFHISDGLPSETIMGIVEDDHNNLWLSTSNGISRFDVSAIKFKNFNDYVGVQNNEFRHNAFFNDEKGRIYFGGQNGINAFYPDSIKDNPYKPGVVITGIKLFNKPVKIGEIINGDVILSKSITETSEIRLSHKNKVISFEFAGLQYAQPQKNQYAYIMENFDEEWNYIGNKKDATYTNLDAGEYIFRVKASNNDGVWNEEGTSIKIIVTPPFWKTWWFVTIVVVLLIVLILGTYFYRIRLIKLQNLVLEKTVRKRTFEINEKNEEILAQNEELEQHRNNLETLVHERTIKLEEALTKAKESDKLKSAFLANMSHEIRTPMNAISGFSELLYDNNLTLEDRFKYVDIIQSNTSSLIKLIDEIIDLSMIESNQLNLRNDIFKLNVLIDQLYSYYSLSNKKPRLSIKKNNTLQSQNLNLNSDNIRIKQILTNLMDNAYKFTEEGYIELGTKEVDEKLLIYVKDTGRGIPSNEMDHIFEQFTKVEEDEFAFTRGLGLGLAISRKIADALDAEILVKSVKGKGSVFTFSVPMEKVITENEIKVQEIEHPQPNNWKGKTILIAEDEDANYLFLKKVLVKAQTNILRARDGEETLNLALENSNIDLILMDIKMPKMSGYEAAKKIKENNPSQIIVAQTAYSRPEELVKFFDDNFDGYLSKPINQKDLIKILEKFL